MNINDLSNNVNHFKNSLGDIEKKRNKWNDFTKSFIQDVLIKVKNTYDLDWNVNIQDDIVNSEAVTLSLSHNSSSIIEKIESGYKNFLNLGGTLTFSQAYNGDVFILILFPIIEKTVTPIQPHKIIMRVEPDKISEELIIKSVADFLDEMTFWESMKSLNTIGFKINK